MNIKAGELYQGVVDNSVIIFIESVENSKFSPYTSLFISYTILGNSKARSIPIGDYAFERAFKKYNQ